MKDAPSSWHRLLCLRKDQNEGLYIHEKWMRRSGSWSFGFDGGGAVPTRRGPDDWLSGGSIPAPTTLLVFKWSSHRSPWIHVAGSILPALFSDMAFRPLSNVRSTGGL